MNGRSSGILLPVFSLPGPYGVGSLGKGARAFVDFVTGRDAQTMIATTLDRRSVRTDVEEPDYLPDKDSLHIIYDDPAVVNENKQKWLSRFDDIFRATLTEGGKGAAE